MRIIYRIGRDETADLVVADPSVSRDHADLVQTEGGQFYWIDRHSTNGSFRQESGDWVRLTKDFVAPGEPIRVGAYETTVQALLPHAAANVPHHPSEE